MLEDRVQRRKDRVQVPKAVQALKAKIKDLVEQLQAVDDTITAAGMLDWLRLAAEHHEIGVWLRRASAKLAAFAKLDLVANPVGKIKADVKELQESVAKVESKVQRLKLKAKNAAEEAQAEVGEVGISAEEAQAEVGEVGISDSRSRSI